MKLLVKTSRKTYEFPVFSSASGTLVNLGLGVVLFSEWLKWWRMFALPKVEGWWISEGDANPEWEVVEDEA